MFFKKLLLLSAFSQAWASDNPCMDAPEILNVVNRPSHIDSACAAPPHSLMIESGYQYQALAPGGGTLSTFPNSEVRLGLPHKSEIFVYVPTYNNESFSPRTGFSGTFVGVKHQFITNQKLVLTTETELALPDGSAAFGAQQTGIIVNGVLNYIMSDLLDLTFMLGFYDLSWPRYYDGLRYSTVNANAMISYAVNGKTDIFAEAYSQSHTGPMMGGGLSMDLGIMYEAKSNIAIDLAVGQRLIGYIGGIDRYITSGISFMF